MPAPRSTGSTLAARKKGTRAALWKQRSVAHSVHLQLAGGRAGGRSGRRLGAAGTAVALAGYVAWGRSVSSHVMRAPALCTLRACCRDAAHPTPHLRLSGSANMPGGVMEAMTSGSSMLATWLLTVTCGRAGGWAGGEAAQVWGVRRVHRAGCRRWCRWGE